MERRILALEQHRLRRNPDDGRLVLYVPPTPAEHAFLDSLSVEQLEAMDSFYGEHDGLELSVLEVAEHLGLTELQP